ncbi:hypothetical protein R8871_04792 [Paraburkholderia graminis C4D1M]|jgi:hypothetical protein|uniref:DUF1326 domain-containing protein n=1 Tax=Paraburkholderia graminis (strain ATCC 700544 / DSM 17151 / LMG 18924 / NCIMB 13744 / C4D1M) TaxID=396598 RepID=B1FUI9_PARG4|nr:DUF1326 domain-containing protein [Paraburkholderia graminis]EDT12299.1 protein of unknown function DUF1326 [Paraburkholderia graminis C4D1M]CAB3720357.1 hypothetical protein R8871_04792 [Paraburkholderia graminis C4D1M]
MTDQISENIDVIPEWQIAGEWFDVCSCNSPCPCTFAQPPTNNHCEVLWAYRINEGHYGATQMAGLKVVLIAGFTGNLWDGAMLNPGVFFDAAADEDQRQALVAIFTGQAGGWMKQFVPTHVSGIKGVEFANISVEVDSALERWSVAVEDKVEASGRAMSGPTSDPTKRLQSYNPPGSEVGPTDAPVTWGKSVAGRWKAFGFDQNIPAGQASKHIPFNWHGPDAP